MKINQINQNILSFENDEGKIVLVVQGDHSSDCCEFNYADFKGSLENAIDLDKNYNNVYITKQVDGPVYGFDLYLDGVRHPINCYSDQNGYYSSDLDVCLIQDDTLLTEFNIDCPVNYGVT